MYKGILNEHNFSRNAFGNLESNGKNKDRKLFSIKSLHVLSMFKDCSTKSNL